MFAKQRINMASEIGDSSTRLFNQKYACSHIPGMKPVLIESIIASTCHIGDIGGSRTQAAKPVRVFHKMVHASHKLLQVLEIGIGKSGSNQGLINPGNFAYTYR